MLGINDLLRWPSACAVPLLLMALACSDETIPPAKPRAPVCLANSSYTCIGKNTCPGRQLCSSDGAALTPCECIDGPTAGSGGPTGADDGGLFADASASPDGAVIAPDGAVIAPDSGVVAPESCSASHACVAEAPAGFEGPIALYVGTKAPPACSAAFSAQAFEAGSDASGAAASCSTCECTPAAASCATFLDFSTGATAACGGTTCTTSVSASCVEIAPPCVTGLATAYLKTKLPSAAPECEPSEQAATKGKAAFGTHVLGCALPDAQRSDCKSDELCAPENKGSAFQDTLCVWKEGDVACPGGEYTDKRVYDRELVDTRKCSACSCDGPDCDYAWKVFAASDTTCATPIVSLTSPEQCVQVNPSSDKVRVGVTLTGTGACEASGGAASGGVTSKDPITVCCAE